MYKSEVSPLGNRTCNITICLYCATHPLQKLHDCTFHMIFMMEYICKYKSSQKNCNISDRYAEWNVETVKQNILESG
jgi:hypothetical protein